MAYRPGASRNPPQGSAIQPRPVPTPGGGGPPHPPARDISNKDLNDGDSTLSTSGSSQRMQRPQPPSQDSHSDLRSSSVLTDDDKEDVLIKELCAKVGKMVCEVANSRETEKISQEEVAKLDLLRVEEAALLELSKTKVDVVAAGLVEAMSDSNVSREFPNNIPEEERTTKIIDAKISLSVLLSNCMDFSWSELRKRISPPPVELETPATGSNNEVDQAESERRKQENEKRKIEHLTESEKIFPALLPTPTANKILEIATNIILKPSPNSPNTNITQQSNRLRAAGRLIYHISAGAIDNPVTHMIIGGITNPDEVASPLNLIEYISMNQKTLGKILEAVGAKVDNDKGNVFKKLGHQLLLARVLTKGIWNWIDHFPMEFVNLCTGTKMEGSPEKMFDVFAGWAAKNKKVKEFWEVQTMLLILCPDIMLKVALEKEKVTKETESKDAFLQQLAKAIEKGKMADVAAVCYVNICKASTNVAKTRENGLRFLVPKIEPVLQTRLFSPENYKMTPSEYNNDPQQVQVMTDCLVAMFRMSARKILISLCSKFLGKDYPPIFKMVLINTFQTIRDEGEKPFVFTIKEIYTTMSGPLRGLFQTLVEEDLKKFEEYKKSTERKTKVLLETTVYNIEILKKLINLFYTEPELPLVPGGQPLADLNASKELMTGLCYCASYFALPDLAQIATSALMELHRSAELINKWCSGSAAERLNGFWDISCAVNVQLANVLIVRSNLTIKEIRQFVNLIKEILARRNAFLAKLSNAAPQGALAKLRTQTNNELETALLIHICNSEPDIVSACAACIGYLCEEIDVVGDEALEGNGIFINYDIYRNLSRGGVYSIGRAAKQRAMRLLMRRTIETYGNVRAWESVYKRWQELTARIVKEEDERIEKEIKAKGKGPGPGGKTTGGPTPTAIPADVSVTWNHLSGFLCAMSGVAIGQELAVEKQDPRAAKSAPMSRGAAPSNVKMNVVDKFVEEMLQLIVSKSDFLKETSTELTGSTLSPTAYGVLFKQLVNVVGTYFGKAGQVQVSTEGNQLVNQTISIVKHILELPQDSYTHADLSNLQQFEQLMNMLLTYTSSCQEAEEPMFPIRMKMKMCGLIEAMMQKHKYMVFSNELNFRIKVLEMVMEWISDFSFERQTSISGGASIGGTPPSMMPSGGGGGGPLPPIPAGGRGRPMTMGRGAGGPPPGSSMAGPAASADGAATIRRAGPAPASNRADVNPDLDVVVLKAMAALLRDLPFIKRGAEDDDEADVGGSSALGRYFQFFTDLLTRTKADPSAKKEKAEHAVVCLSNLLSANIDSALDYFVTMGYHDDLETRAAFLEVLSTILASGTELDAGEGEKYEKMVDLLLEPGLEVVLALCEVIQITEADELAQILVRLFESNDKTLALLRKCIEQEVSSTETPNTLFRRNSMATKLLAAYTKILGKKYLKDTLGPIIQGMIAEPTSMELDPAKIPTTQNREQNLKNVSVTSQAFLDSIARSAEQCPVQFRIVCSILKETVGKRFPGAEAAAIGGFIYLRYICPAIVAPDGFGVVQTVTLTPDVRRSLIVSTKVVQNAANQVPFTKEPHMEPLNDFIKKNIETMNSTFLKFASYSPKEQEALSKGGKSFEISDAQKAEDNAIIHYHLATNLEKIRKVMTGVDSKKRGTESVDLFMKLTTILSQLGTVPDPSQIKKERSKDQLASSPVPSRASDVLFQKQSETEMLFEKQYVDKKILYKQGTTKDKKPVVYFIARKFDIQTFSPQTAAHFVYWIFKTLAEFKDANKKFVLVVDASLFKLKYHDVQGQEFYPKLAKYAPPTMVDNLDKIYVIYSNADFKKYVKRNKKYLGQSILNKVHFVQGIKELFTVVNENDCGLPQATLSIENNAKQSFSVQTGSQKQVLKISNNLISVTSEKPTKMLPGTKQEVSLMEVYHINKIRYEPADGENELILRVEGEKLEPMKCEDLPRVLKELKSCSQRYNLTKKNDNISGQQKRSASVPGTLLNMALLNLGNTNDVLREESYGLLSNLCNHYNLSVQGELRDTSGLCVPKNSAHLALKISRKLARTENQYTLEFLAEALHGVTRASSNMPAKQFTLDYVTNWIPNLQMFCTLSDDPESAARVEKVEKIVNSLLDFTVKETALSGPILSKVWEVMGGVPEVLPLVIECLISRTREQHSGLGTNAESLILDIFASLATPNPRLVSGNLIHRLLKLLSDSDSIKTPIYEDDKLWKQIVILLRILLGLSFDNLIYVQNYLAEIMYIVLMLFGMGSALVRATVHGLLINTVHSLYTQVGSSGSEVLNESNKPQRRSSSNLSSSSSNSSANSSNSNNNNSNTAAGAAAKGNNANKLNGLKLILSELNRQNIRVLYGLGGLQISPHSKPTATEAALSPVNITTTETVAGQILSILSACYTGPGASVGTPHHSRLLSLITKTAWTSNTSLRPRAVISLGVLCNSPALVTDTLIGKILISFRDIIGATGQKLEHDLPLSLIICLTRLFEHVSTKSKFFRQMFWVAMILLEMDEVKLFAAAINLLDMVLRVLDSNDCFEEGISSYCMSAREQGNLDAHLSKSDNITGINFRTSFSFAVAAHLLKGLRRPETKTATTKVLGLLVDISAKSGIGTSMLGYLAAILPVKGEDMEHLKQVLGAEGFMHQYLFTEQMLPDTMHAALLFTTLVTLLKSSDAEVEQLFIYQSLREGVLTMPEAFPVVYQDLIPKMKAAIKNSQNQEIIDACLSIMKSIFNCNYEMGNKLQGTRKLDKDYLKNQWRFQGLVEAGSFQKRENNTDQLVNVAIQVLDTLLKSAGFA